MNKVMSMNYRSLSADPIESTIRRTRNKCEQHSTSYSKPNSPRLSSCRHEMKPPNTLTLITRSELSSSTAYELDGVLFDQSLSPSSSSLSTTPRKISQNNKMNLSFLLFINTTEFVSIINQMEEDDVFQMDNILLDARENRLYQTSHIKYAHSASCHTKTMAKRSIAQWRSLFPRQQGGKNVYIYDHKSVKISGITNQHLLFFIEYLQEQGNRIFILDGGWLKFKNDLGEKNCYLESSLETELVNRYTFSPTNKDSASEDVLNASATLINDFIWLGNERDAHDWELLQRHGITHILNVTNDVPNYYENKRCLTYLRLPAGDNQAQDLIKYFDEAYHFIEKAKRESGQVLVHCWAGVSRSATIVVAYLMRTMQIDLPCALDMVRCRRRVVAPNFNFMGQLERFYKTILSEKENCKSLTHSDKFHASNNQLIYDKNIITLTQTQTDKKDVEKDNETKVTVVPKTTPLRIKKCGSLELRKLSIPCSRSLSTRLSSKKTTESSTTCVKQHPQVIEEENKFFF